MKIAINQAFIEEPEDSDFKAQMRVLEQEIRREDAIAKIEELDEELAIAHSAQIISIFTNNQQLAGYEDELSVDFISSLINQGLAQDELERIIDHILASAAVNIAKDKSSTKKQLAKVFELLAVLERTVRQNQTQIQKPEQLQNSLRQMQEKVRDLAKGGNVENIQKFLKEGELKTAIKQGAEVAVKNPETFRNAAADVSSKIQESQQRAAQQQQLQKPDISRQQLPISQNLNAASVDNSSRNLATQSKPQPQLLSQSQLVLNSSNSVPQAIVKTQNMAPIVNLQVSQAFAKPLAQPEIARNQQQQVEAREARTEPKLQQDKPIEQVRIEAKTEPARVEAKPEIKTEAKPEAKPEVKADVKVDVKPEVKPTEKLEPKIEPKPNEPPPTKATLDKDPCPCPEHGGGRTSGNPPPRQAPPPEEMKKPLEEAKFAKAGDAFKPPTNTPSPAIRPTAVPAAAQVEQNREAAQQLSL